MARVASLLPMLTGYGQPVEVRLPTRQTHDQRDVNCCVSCAIGAAMEARDPSMPALAPLFHFFFAGGQGAIESGLTIPRAQGALLQRGICALARHSYDIARANVSLRPSVAAVQDGFTRRLLDRSAGTLLWRPVSIATSPTPLLRHLAAGFPVILGLQPNAPYLALKQSNPVLDDSRPPFSSVGHAAAVIGYDGVERVFIVQDSRGLSFGAQGQWFLPYDRCTSPFIVLAFALAPDSLD